MKTFFLRPMTLALIFTGLCLTTSLHASAEGDDLRAADAELNRVYQKAINTLSDADAKAKLREAQRAWIAYRDAEIELYAAMGNSGGALKIIQTELTEERTKRLKGIAQDAREGTVQ